MSASPPREPTYRALNPAGPTPGWSSRRGARHRDQHVDRASRRRAGRWSEARLTAFVFEEIACRPRALPFAAARRRSAPPHPTASPPPPKPAPLPTPSRPHSTARTPRTIPSKPRTIALLDARSDTFAGSPSVLIVPDRCSFELSICPNPLQFPAPPGGWFGPAQNFNNKPRLEGHMHPSHASRLPSVLSHYHPLIFIPLPSTSIDAAS